MGAHNVMYQFQADCKWDEKTALDVALDYIDNQNATDAFADYCYQQAMDEGAATWCPAGEHEVHYDEIEHIEGHGMCQECKRRWQLDKFKQGWASKE